MTTPAVSQTTPNAAIIGALYMVAAGFVFALINTTLQAVTMQYGMSSVNAAFWQYLIAVCFSLPMMLRLGSGAFMTQHLPAHLLRIILAVAGIQLWTMGLAHVPIWQAIALVMTSPFFVTFGAKFFLRERVTLKRWAATAAGFGGALIILAPWADDFSYHAFLPLMAAMFWAGASLMTKRLTRHEPADKITFYLLALLTPANAMLALGTGALALPQGDMLWLILLAGLLTALAQWCLTRAYETADASYVQPFDHLKLPMNVIAGWIAFNFIPSGNLWLGAALIILASLYIVREETRK